MRRHTLAVAVIATGLSGCASYTPMRLPEHTNLPASVDAVDVDPAQLPFQTFARHVFDPADGLDIDEVAMLAVANNPRLREARDGLGIARAQSFAAGLLPDPQLGLSGDRPTNGSAGNTSAFNAGLNYDVNALLLRSSRMAAGRAAEQRTDLELLWQEWQVVSQARLLFTRLIAQNASAKQLEDARALLAQRYEFSREALAAGNVTLEFSSAELASLQDVERRINELERSRLQNRASLTTLLGLAADTPLTLVGESADTAIDEAMVRAELAQRLHQRPDLRALRAGYRSQEAKFRGAVLAQFPALTVGLTRARDTSGLYTVGFGLTLSLPVFNRNRGNIAIEKATRKQLFDEYQNRINSATREVAIALENLALLHDQLTRTRAGLGELETVVGHAESAYRAGNIAAADYVRLRTALLDKQLELINLQEAASEQRIALDTLLGPDRRNEAANKENVQ